MWEQTSTIYLENRLTDIKLAQGSKDVGKRVAYNQQKILYIRETIGQLIINKIYFTLEKQSPFGRKFPHFIMIG